MKKLMLLVVVSMLFLTGCKEAFYKNLDIIKTPQPTDVISVVEDSATTKNIVIIKKEDGTIFNIEVRVWHRGNYFLRTDEEREYGKRINSIIVNALKKEVRE